MVAIRGSIRRRSVLAAFPALAAATLLAACSNDSTSPVVTHEYSDRRSGVIAANARVVVVSNPAGPVLVDGLGETGEVAWFLNKVVDAPTPDAADRALAAIVLQDSARGDTLFLSVAAPVSVPGVTSLAALAELSIPRDDACIIREVSGTTGVTNLAGDLEAESLAATTVRSHSGSLSLGGTGGDADVEVHLPVGGGCDIHWQQGNVRLTIPQSTSAQLSAESPNGSIVHSGLAFIDTTRTPGVFSGRLGSGQGTIRLRTQTGDITITAS